MVCSLRAHRLQRLLTVRELARVSKVSHTAIWMAEAGTVQPRLATIRALAQALGVEPGMIAEFRPALGLPPADGAA